MRHPSAFLREPKTQPSQLEKLALGGAKFGFRFSFLLLLLLIARVITAKEQVESSIKRKDEQLEISVFPIFSSISQFQVIEAPVITISLPTS